MFVRVDWNLVWPVALIFCCFVFGFANQSFGQGWPQLDFEIQTFPGAYRVKASTSDGRPVTSMVELNAVVDSQKHRSGTTVSSRKLVINSGKTSGYAEIPYLQSSEYWVTNYLIVEIDENGRLNRNDYFRADVSGNWVDENANQFLYVSSNVTSAASLNTTANPKKQSAPRTNNLAVKDSKKLPTFSELLPIYEFNGWITSGAVTGDLSFLQATVNTPNQIVGLSPADFFRDWTCLVMVKAIFISAADLAILAKAPKQLETLQTWLYAGGDLIVLDAGKNFEDRRKIAAYVGVESAKSQWYRSSDELLQMQGFVARNQWNMNTSSKVVDSDSLPQQPVTAIDSVEGYELVLTKIMQGNLFLTNSNMQSASSLQWQHLYNTVVSQKSITDDIGMHCIGGGFQQRFRIPGIGNPPLIAFQVLIGLYVVVIGPALYFFLNSTGRLYLLLVTVPVLSLFAVGSLFAYGIINDGFSTRGRIQSMTIVDQKLQRALTHSRYVYYSGVRPPASVFPRKLWISNSRSSSSGVTAIRQLDDRQVISGGHIKARSPFQLTSFGVAECQSRIAFNVDEANGDGKLANNFPDRILYALVRTQGTWFRAADIAPNEIALATRVRLDDIKGELRSYTDRIKPDPYFQSSRFRSTYRVQYDTENWGLSSDLIEDLNSGWLRDDIAPENSYLLVLETNALVPDPQPNADLGENQLHVLIGKW